MEWPAIRSSEPPSLFHWMACRDVAHREDNASARLRTSCFGAAAFVLATLRAKAGGADRNRTCDLLIANETLCQLSYDPIHVNRNSFARKIAAPQPLSECASVRIGCPRVLIVRFLFDKLSNRFKLWSEDDGRTYDSSE